ncbi:MAG: hypothetical protein K2X66_17825, partial [Cyanobacteria bacterium]|nr:hypothetical protein [Cyanobacteriota bacterium]
MAKDNINFESISKIHQRSFLPHAVTTWGKELFLEVPLYEAKEPYQVLYVNRELFKRIFPEVCGNSDLSFQEMAGVISAYFSTTLDCEKSTGKQLAQAYIDYQADPLNISLNDNLGSGRAFYQFDIFNIKGEKTPLAKSPRPEYSNGVLELEKAMFETIAANSLYQDTQIQLSPILAILDIGELCRVPWKNTVCKRAKIIRLDLDGSLNRITHLFQTQKPLSKNDLVAMAQKMGIQEGEKFIHRI